jgi:hypothetical protein
MSHLTLEQLYAVILDHNPLQADAEQHLAECKACRRLYDDLNLLVQELAISRAGHVSHETIERYAALFPHIRQQPSRLDTFWCRFRAVLAWDSRQQPALEGVRSAAATASYRLLYASEQAEIELLVERDGHLFRVQGEIVAPDGRAAAPALVQWFDPDGTLHCETRSGPGGQFAVRGLTAGRYQIAIVFASGDSIDIEAVEIG